jgi:Uma2 family endonuclease
MSVITPPVSSGPMPVPVVPSDLFWRLSVDQYHQMIEADILTEDDPVELLEGWLIQKMPKKPPHRVITKVTRDALARIAPAGWYVDSQEPVTLQDSEPEPDAAVVRGDTRQFLDRHPGPQELGLVVEVADTSLQRDRTFKKRVYARAGIPVYWIVNLADGLIEVYTEPSGAAEHPDYQRRQDYRPSDEIPLLLEGREVGRLSVRDLLPQGGP